MSIVNHHSSFVLVICHSLKNRLVATYGTQTSTVILQNNNKLVATYGTQTSTEIWRNNNKLVTTYGTVIETFTLSVLNVTFLRTFLCCYHIATHSNDYFAHKNHRFWEFLRLFPRSKLARFRCSLVVRSTLHTRTSTYAIVKWSSRAF